MQKESGRPGERLAETIRRAYAQGQMDYNLEPIVRVDAEGRPVGLICDGDTVIFCCRRGEREIELTDMFTDPLFDKVPRDFLPRLDFITLTRYHDKFAHIPAMFPPTVVEGTLAETLSRAGKTQLHCAESEKYAHVTFFLNGGVNEAFAGEARFTVPSPRGAYEELPELSAPALTDRLLPELGKYDFTVVNYANGDVIGHTESCEAKKCAARCVSRELARLAEAAFARDMVVLVTADHGNLEIMRTPEGNPHVSHTRSLVPFVVADPRARGPFTVADGSLCDIAPTVLSILGVAPPEAMTGVNLASGHDFGQGRKVLLVILDGWGIGADDDTNAIFAADTPFWDDFIARYPAGRLHASGAHVGLGEAKSGNSEAGHLNIGAGRVVAQDDTRIDSAVADGTFAHSPVLEAAIARVRARGTALHLLGLLSKNSSHGSVDYPLAVCRAAEGVPVFLHLIVDGRSTAQGSTPGKVMELAEELSAIGTGEIVSCVGRGFALDRDGNYDKVKKAYDAMVLGKGTRYGA